jgi:hypothetical protein
MDVSVRVSVARIGRSRRRAVFVDFGNVAFAVDEFGQVVRIGEKVELPRGWEESGDPFLELYLPREGELRGDKKTLQEDGQIPLKRLVLKEHGFFLGYVVDLPDPPLD